MEKFNCPGVKQLRPSAPEFVPQVLTESYNQFNVNIDMICGQSQNFPSEYFSVPQPSAQKVCDAYFRPLKNQFQPEIIWHLISIIQELYLEKCNWIAEKEDLEIKIDWLRNIIRDSKTKNENSYTAPNDDCIIEVKKPNLENKILEIKTKSSKAKNDTRSNNDRNSDLIVSKNIQLHLESEKYTWLDNQINNKSSELIAKRENYQAKVPEKESVVCECRKDMKRSHCKDDLDVSIQSYQSTIAQDTDTQSITSTINLGEYELKSCCNKLRQQNENLKKIVKSQKERRLERELRIKNLKAALDQSLKAAIDPFK